MSSNEQNTSNTYQSAPEKKDFAQAIGFISDLLKDVIKENKQLAVDASALRVQLQDIRSDIKQLNAVVYQSGNGKDPILIRLESLEKSTLIIEKTLVDDASRCLEEINKLQQLLEHKLAELKQHEQDERDKKDKKSLVDREAFWKLISIVLASLLGLFSTWLFLDKVNSTSGMSDQINRNTNAIDQKYDAYDDTSNSTTNSTN